MKTESTIKSLKGKGNPLNRPIKDYFEPRFGVDLGNVRVHTDGNANLLARSIHAKAFTYGNHIVFGEGQYQPDTLTGKKLIAHELTHTIQQDSRGGKIIQRDEEDKPDTIIYAEQMVAIIDERSSDSLDRRCERIWQFLITLSINDLLDVLMEPAGATTYPVLYRESGQYRNRRRIHRPPRGRPC
jgi:hypothetical protein